MTECVFLNYEDFNKLVTFRKGQISSFIEDFVDHLTLGMISVQNVEHYFGHMRLDQNSLGY